MARGGHSTQSRELQPRLLLELANDLAQAVGPGRPRVAALRRSVSTSYYAAFHAIAARTAAQLAPDLDRANQLQICRRIEHRHVLNTANYIRGTGTPKSSVTALVAAAAANADVERAAREFGDLYDARTDADYNHAFVVARQTALANWERAKLIVKTFDSRSAAIQPALNSWCALIALQ